MAEKIDTLQSADGSGQAFLIDPTAYTAKEISGTGLAGTKLFLLNKNIKKLKCTLLNFA